MNFKNLHVIGTSHISQESVLEIERYILQKKPAIVAVELDPQRYHGLMSDAPRSFSLRLIRRLGVTGFLFMVIGGYIQERLAKSIGVKPGADMKTACIKAHEAHSQLILIDQQIERTLQRISQEFGLWQKLRMVGNVCKGLIFRKRFLKEIGLHSFDLRTVPSERLIITMMKYLKKQYPGLYLALVEERNVVMGKRLIFLMKQHPDKHILAVVGAGHVDGMNKYIASHYEKIDVVPLAVDSTHTT